MSDSNLVDRQFKLTGKAGKRELRDQAAVLVQALEGLVPLIGSNTQAEEEISEILMLLRTENFSGKEAGASRYTGFAPTEIEEAYRRMATNTHFEYLQYRHHWHKYPHAQIVRNFPVHLGIESSSVCDLRCKMCFQTDPVFRKNKDNFGLMDYGLYQRIIDEGAEQGLCSVKLSIRGEPILHPMLPQMISYARSKGLLDVMFNTNANKLDEHISRAILTAEPHLVIFSVDADTKELFESIRIGAIFENVVHNIEQFHKIREVEFPESITKTRVQMTVVPEAQHEIPLVRTRWEGMVDQFAVKEALIRQHADNRSNMASAPCRVLWQRLDIHFDGSVWLCDNDYHGKYCVGNVHDSSVADIWHGSEMTRMRNLHANGRKNEIEPCKYCDGL